MQPLPYIFSPHADSPQVRHFGALVAKEFRIPRQLGEIMYHRGLRTLEAVQAFLYPQLSMLPSPDSMKGIGEAVDSIVHACTTASPIFIHGDYDVDGITATALLTVFFNEIGIDTHFNADGDSITHFHTNSHTNSYTLANRHGVSLADTHIDGNADYYTNAYSNGEPNSPGWRTLDSHEFSKYDFRSSDRVSERPIFRIRSASHR